MKAFLQQTGQKWLMSVAKDPKRFYTYSMVILSVSFIGSLIQGMFFPSETTFTIKPPVLYSAKAVSRKTSSDQDQEMKNIINEMKLLKAKRDQKVLQKEDSLRIEFLFSRYQQLKSYP